MSMLGAMVVAGGVGVVIGAVLVAFAVWQWRDMQALKSRYTKRLTQGEPVPVRHGPFVARTGTFGVGSEKAGALYAARRKGWL